MTVYAFGDPSFQKLRGSHDSTEIALFIEEYLDLDLDMITEILQTSNLS